MPGSYNGDWFCSTNIIADAVISKILQPVLTDSYFLGTPLCPLVLTVFYPHLINHSERVTVE